ncbi:hypothetical protein OIU84_022137 [Salix udensis]|uniref:Uncharacterized protein n=1 Tax=Salix udensis TaxID=889485 RepID=A0AAD6PE57_9ROSI|nr:hypothetical protein OIU84_022137 [Salix udensis]
MIEEKFREEPEIRGIKCDSSKLIRMGFEYKYDMRKIIDESLECGKRLGALQEYSILSAVHVASAPPSVPMH